MTFLLKIEDEWTVIGSSCGQYCRATYLEGLTTSLPGLVTSKCYSLRERCQQYHPQDAAYRGVQCGGVGGAGEAKAGAAQLAGRGGPGGAAVCIPHAIDLHFEVA